MLTPPIGPNLPAGVPNDYRTRMASPKNKLDVTVCVSAAIGQCSTITGICILLIIYIGWLGR